MVLAGRLSTFQRLMFNGSSDVVRFFFYFENVAARDKPDNEKALELLCYLDGAAANYFFEIFAPDGTLSEDGKDFQMVKASFISHFKPIEAPPRYYSPCYFRNIGQTRPSCIPQEFGPSV